MDVSLVDTPSDRVEYQLTFDATALPVAELFEWFVDPAKLQRWWAEEATVERVVGGAYTMHWPSIDKTLGGSIVAIEPGERLVFRWEWTDGSEPRPRQVDVTFESGIATLVHADYGDSDEDVEARQNHVDGWAYFLGRLADAVAEAGPA